MTGAPRFDEHGEWKFVTQSQNFVMARLGRKVPHVFTRREWDAMSRAPVSIQPAPSGLDGGDREAPTACPVATQDHSFHLQEVSDQ